jgi:hypothetical protein
VLPYIDEHALLVAASPEIVWDALGTLQFSGPVVEAYGRLIGCEDLKATGPRPLAEGSAFPGFHVVSSEAPRELALAGRHRFARYELTFRIDSAGPATTRLVAESRAEFPGLHGSVYRFLLMRTGAHVISVRRMLKSVRQRAEQKEGKGV